MLGGRDTSCEEKEVQGIRTVGGAQDLLEVSWERRAPLTPGRAPPAGRGHSRGKVPSGERAWCGWEEPGWEAPGGWEEPGGERRGCTGKDSPPPSKSPPHPHPLHLTPTPTAPPLHGPPVGPAAQWPVAQEIRELSQAPSPASSSAAPRGPGLPFP